MPNSTVAHRTHTLGQGKKKRTQKTKKKKRERKKRKRKAEERKKGKKWFCLQKKICCAIKVLLVRQK